MSIGNRFSKYQAKFLWHAENKGIRHAYIKASSLPQLKGKEKDGTRMFNASSKAELLALRPKACLPMGRHPAIASKISLQ